MCRLSFEKVADKVAEMVSMCGDVKIISREAMKSYLREELRGEHIADESIEHFTLCLRKVGLVSTGVGPMEAQVVIIYSPHRFASAQDALIHGRRQVTEPDVHLAVMDHPRQAALVGA